jgi:Pumilio-family RNA binding repeat
MKLLLEYSNNLARDQGGCRFLQKKIEESNFAYLDIIFESTIDYYMELMNDPFGNYLTQKLTETCKED